MVTITRKKRKLISDINVVPYIDVMLVLLIVFMVTAPLLNQGIEVELPPADNEPLEIDENLATLVVTVTSQGEYFLSVGATGAERSALALADVGDRVGRVMRANPAVQVLIEGDRQADWAAMIAVITALQRAGVRTPSFITTPLDGSEG